MHPFVLFENGVQNVLHNRNDPVISIGLDSVSSNNHKDQTTSIILQSTASPNIKCSKFWVIIQITGLPHYPKFAWTQNWTMLIL